MCSRQCSGRYEKSAVVLGTTLWMSQSIRLGGASVVVLAASDGAGVVVMAFGGGVGGPAVVVGPFNQALRQAQGERHSNLAAGWGRGGGARGEGGGGVRGSAGEIDDDVAALCGD